MIETRNAQIESTALGKHDHGGIDFWLMLTYGASGQGFGGYELSEYDEGKNRRVGTSFGMEAIMQVLDIVGVERWEDLVGQHIRVKPSGAGRVGSDPLLAIGHILEDKWFSLEELAGEYKENR